MVGSEGSRSSAASPTIRTTELSGSVLIGRADRDVISESFGSCFVALRLIRKADPALNNLIARPRRFMKILFLHGWHSVPGGRKPSFLKENGHEVINPALPDEDFERAVQIAQSEYDQHSPDIVVGSSRGGAVAMNIEATETPLVLLCPAWRNWGRADKVKRNTVILHSRADDVIPFADSEELVARSGIALTSLIEIGNDHRLAESEPLQAMLEACRMFVDG